MIDSSQSIYYVSYAIISLIIGLAYFKIKSTEGVIITTQEFKIFQSGFLTGYCLTTLGELLSYASFFHTCLYFKLTIEQITKLYVISVFSTTAFNILNDIIDIGSRKNKCLLSAVFYTISSFLLLFGRWEPYEMTLISRVFFGAASALHHSSFDSYIINEHSNNGFPDDWLSYTFTLLSHFMSLIALLTGLLGQTVASNNAPLNAVSFCCVLFISAAVYIQVVWTKDTYNSNKFMLTQLLSNMSSTIQTMRTNKSVSYLIVITVCMESSTLIFTFYWALWLYYLVKVENGHMIPYELIFSSFIAMSMLGNYLYQLCGSVYNYGSEVMFQTVLVVCTGGFVLGAVALTPGMAYFAALVCLFVYLLSLLLINS